MTARMTPALMSAVTPDQHRASDPAASVWVGASAGTGKTKVLTDRVLRLLLGGTAPERILCLTFTRAAAAEMALRITRELARWTVAEDEALAASLAVLTGAAPEQATLDRARRLFATVLDVPDGLKIQTIHAFCQSLLRRFPLEAGVAPNFEIADERMSRALLGAARARLLGAARPEADAALAAALAAMTAVVGEETFGALLADVSRERDRFAALIGGPGGTTGAVSALRARLGVPDGATAAGLLAEACADDAFDAESLAHVARVLAGGKATDQRRGRTIATLARRRRGDAGGGLRRLSPRLLRPEWRSAPEAHHQGAGRCAPRGGGSACCGAGADRGVHGALERRPRRREQRRPDRGGGAPSLLLRGREGALCRARLRRPDRDQPQPAWSRGDRALGALQARRRSRPSADR